MLTDDSNRDLVSRSILPHEYLEPGRARELTARAIEAGGEASLTLHCDASRSRATAYELVLFYPSSRCRVDGKIGDERHRR